VGAELLLLVFVVEHDVEPAPATFFLKEGVKRSCARSLEIPNT
jgi:hypothetical protein